MASDISIDQGKAVAILSKEHQRNLFLDYSDAQRWLAMLLVYHPSRGSSQGKRKKKSTKVCIVAG